MRLGLGRGARRGAVGRTRLCTQTCRLAVPKHASCWEDHSLCGFFLRGLIAFFCSCACLRVASVLFCALCARARSASFFECFFSTINQANLRAPVWCAFALGSFDPVFRAVHGGNSVVWQGNPFFWGSGAICVCAGPRRHCSSAFCVCAPALPGGVGEGLVGLMCVLTFLRINSMRGGMLKSKRFCCKSNFCGLFPFI